MDAETLKLIERLVDEKIALAVDTPRGMIAIGAGCMPAIDGALKRIADIREEILARG